LCVTLEYSLIYIPSQKAFFNLTTKFDASGDNSFYSNSTVTGSNVFPNIVAILSCFFFVCIEK